MSVAQFNKFHKNRYKLKISKADSSNSIQYTNKIKEFSIAKRIKVDMESIPGTVEDDIASGSNYFLSWDARLQATSKQINRKIWTAIRQLWLTTPVEYCWRYQRL